MYINAVYSNYTVNNNSIINNTWENLIIIFLRMIFHNGFIVKSHIVFGLG